MKKLTLVFALLVLCGSASAQTVPPNLALSATAWAETFLCSSYPISALKDGNRNTWWEGTKFPEKCGLTWPSSKFFNLILVKMPLTWGMQNHAQPMVVESSMDGVTWTVIVADNVYHFNGTNPATNGAIQYFDMGIEPGRLIQARHIRITTKKNTITNLVPFLEKQGPQIGEIEVYRITKPTLAP